MSIVVRPFAIEDHTRVLALWAQCPGIGLNDADSRENIAAYLHRNPGMSFVAEADDTLVAAVLCGHDGRRGYLNHLAVLPPFRRRGLGRALVQHCLEALRGAGVGKCHLFVFPENETALRFWQKIGWIQRTDLCIVSRLTETP
ncbi:MAG: GNAT family N-acetyltransferase [Desulfobacterales bacterium]|nr:GNAT family N-acetyltransferase [Desulfobacterales bacterium]